GGFHYKYDGQQWRNTRDDSELYTALSSMISQQGGAEISLAMQGD
ncbi:MAG: iron donor protein CyaY, partial [Oxalobacteraceae bacterium]|nr:iron donor protein CyaY [Oxalobacteraceae bacterium]